MGFGTVSNDTSTSVPSARTATVLEPLAPLYGDRSPCRSAPAAFAIAAAHADDNLGFLPRANLVAPLPAAWSSRDALFRRRFARSGDAVGICPAREAARFSFPVMLLGTLSSAQAPLFVATSRAQRGLSLQGSVVLVVDVMLVVDEDRVVVVLELNEIVELVDVEVVLDEALRVSTLKITASPKSPVTAKRRVASGLNARPASHRAADGSDVLKS